MRPAAAVAIALAAAGAALLPAAAAGSSRTRTPVRIAAPSPANATVAGFKLSLVRSRAAAASLVLAGGAAGLPRNVTVYAVVARQKRSDRISGALVAVHRADAVAAAGARAAARTLTVNIRHEAIPRGFRLSVKLEQRRNVLDPGRVFLCRRYFRTSDLAGAQRLSGPRLPNITIGTIFQAACNSARSRRPYATLGEFRSALNARSGAIVLTASQLPNEVDGTARFNFPVQAFGVLADSGHRFTGCGFSLGSCQISSTAHPSDYAVFSVAAPPAAANSSLPFALAMTPPPMPKLPFQFFGTGLGGGRLGPLLTRGP
jgi:hypothetical protein